MKRSSNMEKGKKKKKKREREESGEKEAELNNRDGKDTERDGGGEEGRKE